MKTKYYHFNQITRRYEKCSKWIFKVLCRALADRIELIPNTIYTESDCITLNVMYNTKDGMPVCKAEIRLF